MNVSVRRKGPAAPNGGKAPDPFGNDLILIRCGLPIYVTAGLILMELMNASNTNKFSNVISRARKGLLKSRESFALDFEKIEYGGLRKHHEIVTSCCKDCGWRTEADFCHGNYASFDQYAKANDHPTIPNDPDSSHTGVYRQMYDQVVCKDLQWR
mmetsp:Transcript_5808/g.8947  ORF Transcript_5808/g.8947 Transcript_5808/m.8947 type:complete len:155 (-) Transcript_5808:274-738(-)